MNADRIIVVNGGEVIEEGNHESLINAGGKYADLWAKQVFVKAKNKDDADEDNEDGSKASSGCPTIVNDLTTEEVAELTKVSNTSTRAATPTNDSEPSNAQNSGGDDDDATSQTPAKGESGHKKEV